MVIRLKSRPAKFAAFAVTVLGAVLLLGWSGKAYLATRLERSPSLRNLTYAVRLDPSSAEYQWELGRLLEYSPESTDPSPALDHLRRATELSPYDPSIWLDLGSAYEFQGRTSEAVACLRRADFLAPTLPNTQWGIGNFFLLHGDIDESFKHFSVVLVGSDRYTRVIFDTAWKVSGDPAKILDELIPRNLSVEFNYLGYLLGRRDYASAAGVWKRIITGPDAFRPELASGYVDSLINAGRPVDAWQVWSDLRSRGLLGSDYAPGEDNAVLNGDFETTPLNLGFDWRLVPTDDAYSTVDQGTFHSPSHSLLIQFLGKQNLNFQNVFQFVRVSPNHAYRLQAYVKTEDITTDSGPRLMVRDAYDLHLLEKYSDDLKGTNGWTSVTLDFRTSPKTELLVVAIARLPSEKFDNLISGKVWVDDVSLATARP